MTAKGQRYILLTAVILSLIAGCSLPGPQQSTAKRTYLLQGIQEPDPAGAAVSRSCVILRISTPGSAPGFMTSRMAYTNTPQRLDYFAYHEWVDTPARMLASLIEGRLDSAGMFAAVVSGSSDVRADFRLDSEVTRLLQDFDAEGSKVILKVKVNLINVATRSLLSSQSFSYAETSNGSNPEAGVAAANHAAERFLVDLMGFVAESIGPLDCSQPD